MSPSTYEELLSFVAPAILKQDTVMRDSVGSSERLAVTLRYLVTGDAQCTIAATISHKNIETNEKFYRKVAFLMYTEMVNFRPSS